MENGRAEEIHVTELAQVEDTADHYRDTLRIEHTETSVPAKRGRWTAAKYTIGNQGFNCLGFNGATINLVVYFTDVLHQGNATAATSVSTWNGAASLFPIIGAFLADAYWGRYETCAVFSCIGVLGMGLMVLSATLSTLKPKSCPASLSTTGTCKKATSLQISVFYVALYVMSLGSMGYLPCLAALGGDQFDEEIDKEKQEKSSFFNWFYLSINVGTLFASTLVVYLEQSISWGLGFTICLGAMLASVLLLICGSQSYKRKKSGGNPIPRVLQVLVASARKWKVEVQNANVDGNNELYEVLEEQSAIEGSRKVAHTKAFRFLDKAAMETEEEKESRRRGIMISPWVLCTVTQVEEVKFMLRLFPVWVASIIFSTVSVQMSTLFVEQGSLMNTHIAGGFTIPAAALSAFNTVGVIIWVPIYDRIIVQVASKWTGNPHGLTKLQRIGTGLAISIFSMVAAAMVEVKRLHVAQAEGVISTGEAVMGMSVFWQTPQYIIIGAAQVFTFIGLMELLYDESPDTLKSLAIALMGLSSALGSYLSALLVTVTNRITSAHGDHQPWIPEDNLNLGHLDNFFWLLAVISAANLLFFMCVSRRYHYTVHVP